MRPQKNGTPRRPESPLSPTALGQGERVLGARQAAELYGVSITGIPSPVLEAGKTPPPIRLSERRLGWRVRDLLEHLSKRTDAAA